MKGWLTVRSGPLLLNAERYFFRLQWGFLGQYICPRSVAINRYCIHASAIETNEENRKIVLTIGPLGFLSAHGTDSPLGGGGGGAASRKTFLKRRAHTGGRRSDGGADADADYDAARHNRKPRRLVLVADTTEEFQMWALLLNRGRARNIARRFKAEGPVGNGAAGDVFRSSSLLEANLQVAVKRIEYNSMEKQNTARNLRRIQKEVQTQVKAASRSPYVVGILDVFFDSRYVYLVMELVTGGSLRELLERQGSISEEMAVSVAKQIALFLLVLHQHSIVHRDVKADNCLLHLDANGVVDGIRMTDFGFAEVCRNGDMDTFCSTFLGTASYMAPEIAYFDRYGAPVDMYALGILCCAMQSGLYPYDDDGGLIATLEKIKEADPVVIRGSTALSSDAKSFCLALLNPDPKKRLTAAAALQHRWLRRGINTTAGLMSSPGLDRSPKAWLRRIFHIISSVLAMQRWASAAPRPRPALHPDVVQSRLVMLQRLDREVLSKQPVRRPSKDTPEELGEVFGEDGSSASRYDAQKRPLGPSTEME